MGVSTDAILAYGVDLGEWNEGTYPELDELMYSRDQPIELVSHCSGEHPMWMLVLKEPGYRAHRGYPSEIDPASLTVPNDASATLRAACDKYGLPWSEPKWILASDKG